MSLELQNCLCGTLDFTSNAKLRSEVFCWFYFCFGCFFVCVCVFCFSLLHVPSLYEKESEAACCLARVPAGGLSTSQVWVHKCTIKECVVLLMYFVQVFAFYTLEIMKHAGLRQSWR